MRTGKRKIDVSWATFDRKHDVKWSAVYMQMDAITHGVALGTVQCSNCQLVIRLRAQWQKNMKAPSSSSKVQMLAKTLAVLFWMTQGKALSLLPANC